MMMEITFFFVVLFKKYKVKCVMSNSITGKISVKISCFILVFHIAILSKLNAYNVKGCPQTSWFNRCQL